MHTVEKVRDGRYVITDSAGKLVGELLRDAEARGERGAWVIIDTFGRELTRIGTFNSARANARRHFDSIAERAKELRAEAAPEPTCVVCGRTQAQVEAAEPGPHFRMRHGKCEDCASGSDYRTCTLPNCTDHHERSQPEPEPSIYTARTEQGATVTFTDTEILGIVYPHGGAVVPLGFYRHNGTIENSVITTAERALLTLPAATGTPTERRATLERAFDSNAARLLYNYGAMRADPACAFLIDAISEAIADDWHARPFWSERIAA